MQSRDESAPSRAELSSRTNKVKEWFRNKFGSQSNNSNEDADLEHDDAEERVLRSLNEEDFILLGNSKFFLRLFAGFLRSPLMFSFACYSETDEDDDIDPLSVEQPKVGVGCYNEGENLLIVSNSRPLFKLLSTSL